MTPAALRRLQRGARRAWRALANVTVLSALLGALIGGGFAVLGGYVGSQVSQRAERELRREDRAAAVRGAARVLDLELYSRLRLILTFRGIEPPPGPVTAPVVMSTWRCALDKATLPDSADCRVRGALTPNVETRLSAVPWTIEDRRLLGSVLSGAEWFRVTTTVDDWRQVADVYPRLRSLIRANEARRRRGEPPVWIELRRVLEELIESRETLADYV